MFQNLIIKPLVAILTPKVVEEALRHLGKLQDVTVDYVVSKKEAFSKPARKKAIRHKVALSPNQKKHIRAAYKEWRPNHIYKEQTLITQQDFATIVCSELKITRSKNYIIYVARHKEK